MALKNVTGRFKTDKDGKTVTIVLEGTERLTIGAIQNALDAVMEEVISASIEAEESGIKSGAN